MNKQSKQKKFGQGFTIIEVMLVLAIAGLIFLMVFIALPALQRGQRDAGRKNDVSTVVSALQTYLSNNRGSFSSINSASFQKYIDKLGQYDVTSVIVHTGSAAGSYATVTDQIDIYTGLTCPASLPAPGTVNIGLVSGGSRQAAVITPLENNGSQAQAFCQSL